MQLLEIPLECLREPGSTSRIEFDEEGVRELAASIQREGLLHPLHVKEITEGIFEVVAGHRRLMALRLLRWPQVPCFLVPPGTDPEFVKVHENLHRRNLNPYEEALAVEKMHREFGLTYDQIAVACSRSPSWVIDRMRLRAYPEGLQEMIRDDRISLQVARVLSRIDDPLSLQYYAEAAAKNGVTELVARQWYAQYLSAGPVTPGPDGVTVDVAQPAPPTDPQLECAFGGHFTLLSKARLVRICSDCFQALAEAVASGGQGGG